MNIIEAAAALNDNQYGDEGSLNLFAKMKAAGLVAVFGASDDLMEFRGAIDDEVGAYNGATALVDHEGLLPERDGIDDDDELERFFTRKKVAVPIRAKFSDEGFTFTYETKIPHETFIIRENDDTYCRGIVFALADAKAGK